MAQIPSKNYFAATEVVDWQQQGVFALAQQFAIGITNTEQMVDACQRWVEQNIATSCFDDSLVSCSASEVLSLGEGCSFSKSHLLAALLRANGLASSFCYQRLSTLSGGLQLIGYCAVWLTDYGWYPLILGDIPQEPLEYAKGEFHYRIYSHAPLPEVIRALQYADCWGSAKLAIPIQLSMG